MGYHTPVLQAIQLPDSSRDLSRLEQDYAEETSWKLQKPLKWTANTRDLTETCKLSTNKRDHYEG